MSGPFSQGQPHVACRLPRAAYADLTARVRAQGKSRAEFVRYAVLAQLAGSGPIPEYLPEMVKPTAIPTTLNPRQHRKVAIPGETDPRTRYAPSREAETYTISRQADSAPVRAPDRSVARPVHTQSAPSHGKRGMLDR